MMQSRSFKTILLALLIGCLPPATEASTEEQVTEELFLTVWTALAFVVSYYCVPLRIDKNELDKKGITSVVFASSPSYKNPGYLAELSTLRDGLNRGLLGGACQIIPTLMVSSRTIRHPDLSHSPNRKHIIVYPPVTLPIDQSHVTTHTKKQTMYETCSGDGGGDGDGDGYTSTEEEDDSDDFVNRQFDNLKRQVGYYKKTGFRCSRDSCKVFHFRSQYHLFKKLGGFASRHPTYAVDAYKLATQLPFVSAIRLAIAAPVIYGISVDFGDASFHDLSISIPRAFISTLRMMFKTIIPLVVGEGADLLSLWGGIIITSTTDNAFAHLDNSVYAMPWGSEESADFALRVIATTLINYMWLKPYKAVIVPLLARPLNCLPAGAHRQSIHLAVDIASTTFFSYLAIALQIAGYPYLSLTAGPNPFGPAGVYPIPYCSQEVKWIFWGRWCRGQSNSTFAE